MLALLLGATASATADGITSVLLNPYFDAVNLQSMTGVPLSSSSNNPAGSNGKLAAAQGTPSPQQFSALLSFGGVDASRQYYGSNTLASVTNVYFQGTNAFSIGAAQALGLPSGSLGGGNYIVEQRAQIGGAYYVSSFSVLFGSQISPPITDANGVGFTDAAVAASYWQTVPYPSTNPYPGYYYSPNSGKVYAAQAGLVSVTWQTTQTFPVGTTNNYVNPGGGPSFSTNGTSYCLLYTTTIGVSSVPVKTPQNMYWTEGSYENIGVPVTVPRGTVYGINVIYNDLFPQNVTSAVEAPPGGGVTNLNTLWFDVGTSTIRAYNKEGLVFVEIVGPPNTAANNNEFLGFEIVQVARAATPQPVTIPLGNQLTPFQDGFEGKSLFGGNLQGSASTYVYTAVVAGNPVYYADAYTPDINDVQLFWLSPGVAGLRWPDIYDSYTFYWPSDPSQYSWYVRPPATNQLQASLTAIQLDGNEQPSLDYQDPLDQPRGFLTSSNAYYSYLTVAEPAHRALLRFSSTVNGSPRFERVFSYLAEALENNALFSGSVATNFSGWDPTNEVLANVTPGWNPPYVTSATVYVGQQITPPAGELGSTNGAYGDYWAGWINTSVNAAATGVTNDTVVGNSYDPQAYIDPIAHGFTLANMGAIIPVNAIPGQNALQVFWFRSNGADPNAGFQPAYWPSVIGNYTIAWPTNAPLIVLANNAGTGPLPQSMSGAQIYYQNDPTQPGYNPNEEHAVMMGGQAYALRTDLNNTNATGYSSAPYVLLSYTGADGRPAMNVYGVVNEYPAAGQYFDYVTPAGQMVQAPMPLPLMPLPLAVDTNSATGFTNYNSAPPATGGDLPAGWAATSTNLGLKLEFSDYQSFTFQDRNHNYWVYRGPHAGMPPLQFGRYNAANSAIGSLTSAFGGVGDPFNYYIQVSRRLDSITASATGLPDGLSLVVDATNGLMITGVPTTVQETRANITLTDTDGSVATNSVLITIFSSSVAHQPGPVGIESTNTYTGEVVFFTNRPPSLAANASPSNTFTMNYYYATLAGFAWPGIANPPPVGSIVPYLRPLDTNGVPVGDPTSSSTPSLPIVYRPVWPGLINGNPTPTLFRAQTLTTAINDLTAVRGQDSVQVLYQQSIATNTVLDPGFASVVLFDPEVQKTAILTNLPAGVVADLQLGLYYFPNLPANLISRVWFDPNQEKLVFQGKYVKDVVNGDYVMLNVLRGDDLNAVNGLCPPTDPMFSVWTNAVASFSVAQVEFGMSTASPGLYEPQGTNTFGTGDLVTVQDSDTAVVSYAMSAVNYGGWISYIVQNDLNPKLSGDPVSVAIARVSTNFWAGNLVLVNAAGASPFSQTTTFQYTSDFAGETTNYLFDWRLSAPGPNDTPPGTNYLTWPQYPQANPGPLYTLGAQGIQGLTDNYVTMRYGFVSGGSTNWAPWPANGPLFVPGWIKRVTQAIDPIAGSTQNLLQSPAQTTASLIELAGSRWQGDVPLNAGTLTNNGLIQVYETVLDMGQSLSVNAGINYGPANQALLLAAGYLNDLYMILGNDAWANSQNPTIGFGTSDTTYGSVATASFVFEGEEPTLLEQNLALLRGRNDSESPGVTVPPVYNHLWWNYTYGISAGETIYALNYNITDQNADGVVNAADAAIMYPQGHGDAYGHYLTALTDYVKLLMNPNFDWVPQSTVVSVLGASVAVNYQDEQKFATTAAALARTGEQIFGLTFREGYLPGTVNGWSRFSTNYVGPNSFIDLNGHQDSIVGYWGLDHWAARVGQGTYLNWVMGNSMLEPLDTVDTGIQQVDRTTVKALQELPSLAAALENDMDNANAGFTPLGLSQNAIAFDINPAQVTGVNPQTHFEQVYARAVQALDNAVVAFNAAQNVTTGLRQQQNSLTALKAAVTSQEQAYNNQLIELYGTPYPEDIGPAGTYPQGYTGPDLVHYMYVDASTNSGGSLLDPTQPAIFTVGEETLPDDWASNIYSNFNDLTNSSHVIPQSLTFVVNPDQFGKPVGWSTRGAQGSIQTAALAVNNANDAFRTAAAVAQEDQSALFHYINLNTAQFGLVSQNFASATAAFIASQAQQIAATLYTTVDAKTDTLKELAALQGIINVVGAPTTIIAGTAAGGNQAAPAATAVTTATDAIEQAGFEGLANVFKYAFIVSSAAYVAGLNVDYGLENANDVTMAQQNASAGLQPLLQTVENDLVSVNKAQEALTAAQNQYVTLLSQGNRIQQQRLTMRQQTAAQVQGDTVANAAFLVFQNEDLERYNTLFNTAAQYAYLAANAFDYDTGLLGTPAGQSYLNQIISSCALGVIGSDGTPQISGSGTGDPGLANALAEMKADYDALDGRLGFNNPDGNGTIVSLRAENFRINPDSSGDNNWQQVLGKGMMADLRADMDVMNHCLQIDDGSGQAVPGIVLTFSTTISDGQNLFGQPLAPGDHAFSSSSFATKIFAAGVDFDGYVGMDNPISTSGTGGTPATNPSQDPNGLAANPYVYLIPCGVDSMRSPPLGDTSTIRNWTVDDVAIPLPYNIGASSFSQAPFYQAANSLSEPLYAVRKHQAFRPVSSLQAFNTSIYGAGSSLQASQYTNERLIGRSVWNSKWKLVIPGRYLLYDPNQGLARFIQSVKDIHLYFVTYSYAGN